MEEFIKDKKGRIKEARLVKLEGKKDPETGRMIMAPVEGSQETVPAELVLIAAGFLGAQAYTAESFGVSLNARTCVDAPEGTYATNVPGVYAAGDMRRGQSLVVWAIQEGREAARAVDKALMGYSNL